METSVSSIMTDLKAATQPLHDDTEAGRFNKLLVMGKIPVEGYISSLEQLFLIHRALEAHLRERREHVPAFSIVLKDVQFQEPYLREDLEHFGRSPNSISPLAPTRKFMAYVEKTAVEHPIALLGIHYVFEGSNNGSRHIATALRRAYALHGTQGTRYFDPYGDQQADVWRSFKADMARTELTPEESAAMVDAACRTFEAVKQLHEALYLQYASRDTVSGAAVCPFGH